MASPLSIWTIFSQRLESWNAISNSLLKLESWTIYFYFFTALARDLGLRLSHGLEALGADSAPYSSRSNKDCCKILAVRVEVFSSLSNNMLLDPGIFFFLIQVRVSPSSINGIVCTKHHILGYFFYQSCQVVSVTGV